jgi:aerobic-type carbon monoxide dehydrogenase small subunit (CoxS/CutS family)
MSNDRNNEMTTHFELYINDNLTTIDSSDADLPLIDLLQEYLNLTGTKLCCGIGVCRACTVNCRSSKNAPLEKVLACSTPLSALQGQYIYTVESLANSQALSPLQAAFLRHFSFQCGYCAPGFLMAAQALIERIILTKATENQLDSLIETWVGENLCRCTGYVRYLEAIREVALDTIANGWRELPGSPLSAETLQNKSELAPMTAPLYKEAKV